MSESEIHSIVLLYDGVCGFCNKTVQFVLDRDRKGTMKFAALQSDFAAEIVSRHPELAGIDSVVLVECAGDATNERVSIKSTAALRLARYLGGIWSLGAVGLVIPRPIRDFFYDVFARNRYRWFGRFDACAIPPKDVRSRFLGT